MQSTPEAEPSGRKAPPEDPGLDEACFLSELRRAVEGAPTAAEERLARRDPDWMDRIGRISARFAG